MTADRDYDSPLTPLEPHTAHSPTDPLESARSEMDSPPPEYSELDPSPPEYSEQDPSEMDSSPPDPEKHGDELSGLSDAQSQTLGVPTFDDDLGVPTFDDDPGVPTFDDDLGVPTFDDDPTLAPGNTHDTAHHHLSRLVVEWILVAVVSLALALVLRTFIVQAFFIPSISMHPTLHVGDRIVVDKVGYRFREVSRGDIVVFSRPESTSDIKELIKRVVAVGGDTFEISEDTVRINGKTLDEPYLQPNVVTLPKSAMSGCVYAATTSRCEVPEGTILVLGDNREASQDSRFFGPVDVDKVVGRAFLRIWPPGSIGGL